MHHLYLGRLSLAIPPRAATMSASVDQWENEHQYTRSQDVSASVDQGENEHQYTRSQDVSQRQRLTDRQTITDHHYMHHLYLCQLSLAIPPRAGQ